MSLIQYPPLLYTLFALPVLSYAVCYCYTWRPDLAERFALKYVLEQIFGPSKVGVDKDAEWWHYGFHAFHFTALMAAAAAAFGVNFALFAGAFVVPNFSILGYSHYDVAFITTLSAVFFIATLTNFVCGAVVASGKAETSALRWTNLIFGHVGPLCVYLLANVLRQRNLLVFADPDVTFTDTDTTPADLDAGTTALFLFAMIFEVLNSSVWRKIDRKIDGSVLADAPIHVNKMTHVVEFATFEFVPLTLSVLTLGWSLDFYAGYPNFFLIVALVVVIWLFSGWQHPERFTTMFFLVMTILTLASSFALWGATASGAWPLTSNAFVPNADFFLYQPIVFPSPTNPLGIERQQIMFVRYALSVFALAYTGVHVASEAYPRLPGMITASA